jgi:signal transduction histidine kinase/CheY-like chemotaxis protein
VEEDDALRAVALRNAQVILAARQRAEEELREERRLLELLNRTGASIASQLDLRALVQSVTDATTELTNAKFGAFFYNVINEQGEAFLLYTLSGAPREAFEKFGLPRNTPVFQPTFRGQGVVRSDDITRDPRYGTVAPHHGMPQGHLPVRSYLAVPVVSRSGEVIGGLFFGHPQPGVFRERDERLVVGIAAQAAMAIDNARLYEAAQKSAEERKRLLESERAARAEAERMSELKDDFLATLSHELRTPLSAILGWSQVLRRRKVSEAELRNAIDIIERNARAQTQLIEDLLDISAITSGKLRLEVQPLEPAAVIEGALETVRPSAAAKGIRLEKVLDPSAGPISGDPGRLQQVVWNLLSNAIKFTPKGGKVQVLLQRVDSQVEISVSDTGAGIRPEFLVHLFERFRQADASTTRKHGGLGLGLSIVRHLVELHGGTVRAHSAGEGQGASFSVRLPLAAVKAPADDAARLGHGGLRQPPPDYRLSDLTGLRVLVVDDEPDARELLKRVLSDCGAEVLAASSAAEALALIRGRLLHVLVSDIGMPEVDGYELLRRVRALEEGSGRLPAIALTAFARSEDRTRALRAGFLVHMSKPVEPAELVATVASVAGRASG